MFSSGISELFTNYNEMRTSLKWLRYIYNLSRMVKTDIATSNVAIANDIIMKYETDVNKSLLQQPIGLQTAVLFVHAALKFITHLKHLKVLLCLLNIYFKTVILIIYCNICIKYFAEHEI